MIPVNEEQRVELAGHFLNFVYSIKRASYDKATPIHLVWVHRCLAAVGLEGFPVKDFLNYHGFIVRDGTIEGCKNVEEVRLLWDK